MPLKFGKPISRAAERKVDKREAETRWQKVRREVLARDKFRCRSCKARTDVEVHHVRFRSVGGDRFDAANLVCLCRSCHCEIHAYRLVVVGPQYDANGKLLFQRHAIR